MYFGKTIMLSSRLEQTLNKAFEIAGSNEHEFVTLEHLLVALLDDKMLMKY